MTGMVTGADQPRFDPTIDPLARFAPRPMVQVPVTGMERPRFPVIDAHNHLGRWLSGHWMIDDVDELVGRMDRLNVELVVNLDGRWGAELEANLDRYDRAHPGRFATFGHVDWSLLATADGDDGSVLVDQVEAAVAAGAKGLKIWKDLGLGVRDVDGELVRPDDDRVIEVVQAAGRAGIPVLVHCADPKAFFEPLDRTNERIEELAAHPDWWFGADGLPTFDELLAAFERLVAACPDATIIGAHVGNCAEDLSLVGRMLNRHDNYLIDLGARMAELGRQPRAARRLMLEHGDRILFGTDAFPLTDQQLRLWFRFLETDDECFDYAPEREVPPQGRWTVSALDLPDDVLARIYHANARRVLGVG